MSKNAFWKNLAIIEWTNLYKGNHEYRVILNLFQNLHIFKQRSISINDLIKVKVLYKSDIHADTRQFSQSARKKVYAHHTLFPFSILIASLNRTKSAYRVFRRKQSIRVSHTGWRYSGVLWDSVQHFDSVSMWRSASGMDNFFPNQGQ